MTEHKYNFIDRATNIREAILDIEEDTKEFKLDVVNDDMNLIESVSDKGEILANITLAYRHIEDARMRIGKAIQAYDGGASEIGRAHV